jgi:hypothetical protein
MTILSPKELNEALKQRFGGDIREEFKHYFDYNLSEFNDPSHTPVVVSRDEGYVDLKSPIKEAQSGPNRKERRALKSKEKR